MRPPCRSTSGDRPKAEHFPFLDGFSLDGSARRPNQPRQAFLFTDRTHLSANAFRFGLLAGNFNGFTAPAFNIAIRRIREHEAAKYGFHVMSRPFLWLRK